MTPLDGLSVLALVHRLAALDELARTRVSRLLCIDDLAAGVLLRLAGRESVPASRLRTELALSTGAGGSLVAELAHEALVCREPDPRDPGDVRLRLAPGAALELAAALAPLVEELSAVASDLAGLVAAVEHEQPAPTTPSSRRRPPRWPPS